jgi:hypothetical protein
MARDVEADINLNDKSSRGLRGFLSNLRKADDQAKKTQGNLDKVSSATGKLGKSADDNSRSISKLHDELGIAQHELGSLARAFAKAQSASERIDLSKAMKRQESEIRKLTKNINILEAIEPKPSDVSKFAKVFGGSISESVSSAGAALGPVLVGVAIGSAPLIGATISAAVIGGAGLGGIVGGLVLASKDPRVEGAFKGAVSGLKTELTDAASSFVDPTIKAIEQISGSLKKINFKQIFGDASKFLPFLTSGISTFIEKVGGGIEKLIHNARPVMEALGTGIAAIGGAIGDVFEELSDNGVDAALALQTVFGVVVATIKAVGTAVNVLTESFGLLARIGVFGPSLQSQYFALKASQDLAVQGASAVVLTQGLVARAFGKSADSATTNGAALLTLDERMNQVYNSARNLFDAETDAAGAMDSFKKSISENGKTLDLHTEKGRANRDALSKLAATLNANYKAFVDVNGEGIKANGIATSNYNSFIKAATGAGISSKAAADYARKLGLVPPKKQTDFYANTHDAEARTRALQEKIDSIHGKTVTVHVSVTGTERLDATGHRIGGYRAAGGPVYPNTSYVVGEHGPEILQMGNQAGKVIPNNQLGDGGGNVYEFHIDLGNGVKQVIRAHDRDIKRRVNARVATA